MSYFDYYFFIVLNRNGGFVGVVTAPRDRHRDIRCLPWPDDEEPPRVPDGLDVEHIRQEQDVPR